MGSSVDPSAITEASYRPELDPEIQLNEEFISAGSMPSLESQIVDGREISLDEAAELGAIDGTFFGHYFFPKTSRQDSPPFHDKIWGLLDEATARRIGIQVFRGGAKTSLLRIFTARRVAYGLSNTILYIGKSEKHAVRSVEWLKRHIEFNPLFKTAFQLEKGSPWSSTEIDIRHKTFDYPIRVLGTGITGSVRGINVDDFRPDLIILDDVIDEENANTYENRQKINELIFGAVYESLQPRSENPHAKIVMLQTPLDPDDASEMVQRDPSWHSIKISCFGADGQSSWPARWSTNELLEEKESAARRNMLSVWLREKECTVVADETRYFRWDTVNYWDILPEGKLVTAIGIDPSPPKDEEEQYRKKKEPDPEVISVVGLWPGTNRKYVLEYAVITDPNPEKTWDEFYRLARKWRVRGVGIESVAYQATLKWFFDRKMQKRQWFIPVHKIDDKRKKTKRIRQRFSNMMVEDELYVHPSMNEFKTQYENYPNVAHDDVLDSADIGFEVLLNYELAGEGVYGEDEIEDLPATWRAAP